MAAQQAMASFDARVQADLGVERELEQGRKVWWQHGIDSRHHGRHLVEAPCGGSLVFDRGIYPPLEVDLFDRSVGGACLLTPHPVEVMRGDQAELQFDGDGRRRVWVCWSEMRDQLTALGVAFEEPEDLAA